MKVTIQHRNIQPTGKLNSSVKERILALKPRLQIDEAKILLEQNFEVSPPFAVRLHLVTPGPDVIAEGRDYTIQAAMNKMLGTVNEELVRRSHKRVRKLKNKSKPLNSGRVSAPR